MSTIDITDCCNLDCAYCYSHNGNSIFVPKRTVLDLALTLHSAGTWQIVIGGGEPFLHPDLLEIIVIALRRGVSLAVTTNGTVLSRNRIDAVARLQKEHPGKLTLQVSLDAPTPSLNDVLRARGKDVLRNIDRILAAGIEIGIGTVLHRFSVDEVQDLLDRFYPQVKRFHFLGLMPSHPFRSGETPDMCPSAEQMKSAHEQVSSARAEHPDLWISFPDPPQYLKGGVEPGMRCAGCTAAVTRMDINARGDALACHIADRSVMGNVHEQTLEEIWHSPRAREYRHSSQPPCGRIPPHKPPAPAASAPGTQEPRS